ncbi:hypothetical protein H5410_031920 [Solanum commersonii]|uniref:Uncharacterized protein n=1 Tax=Solanum commersonii TaxID=4109 RepID=A0A9J5YNU6_SOLCO|nr:hypothetical protein H5410_031920 [Solanum commersonii]
MQTPKSRNSNIPSKNWMDLARYSKEYIVGVESFHVQNVVIFIGLEEIWINHGEWDVKLNVDVDMDYSRDDIDGLLNDQFRDVAQAEGAYDGPNEDAKKFYNLVEEASQELYPGCTGFSKLSFTLRLYLLKRARNNDECEPSDAEIMGLFPNRGVHAYLLGNCDECMLCREHEQEVNNQPRRSKWRKAKNHCQNFSQWFETRALQEDVPYLIKQLSRGPNYVAKRYSGYLINGYRFHVRQRDARRKTQNCGVTLVASTTRFASSKDKYPIAADLTYYGRIIDIRCSQEEPFVLGSQVHQCFYVQDPYDQDKHYVMKTVPRDLFNMGDQVESNLPQSYENEPSEHLMGPSIPKDNGEVLLTRNDVPETIIDVPSEEFVTQQLKVEEEEFEDESENEYEDESENELEDESEEEFE